MTDDYMKSYRMRVALGRIDRIAAGEGALIRTEYVGADEHPEGMDEEDRRMHGIVEGDEYILVRSDVNGRVLYAVNVSADSVLTAISELMKLLAQKF